MATVTHCSLPRMHLAWDKQADVGDSCFLRTLPGLAEQEGGGGRLWSGVLVGGGGEEGWMRVRPFLNRCEGTPHPHIYRLYKRNQSDRIEGEGRWRGVEGGGGRWTEKDENRGRPGQIGGRDGGERASFIASCLRIDSPSWRESGRRANESVMSSINRFLDCTYCTLHNVDS